MQQEADEDSGIIRLRRHIQRREHRARPRFPVCRAATIRLLAARTDQREAAVVCNVTGSGLGLHVLHPLPVKTPLFVEFEGAPIKPRVVSVTHVTKAQDGVMLGCELYNALTTAELEILRVPEK